MFQLSDAEVAGIAQEPAIAPREPVVIYTKVAILGGQFSTDSAASALMNQQIVVLGFGDSVDPAKVRVPRH
jgi:hypothetical protein